MGGPELAGLRKGNVSTLAYSFKCPAALKSFMKIRVYAFIRAEEVIPGLCYVLAFMMA